MFAQHLGQAVRIRKPGNQPRSGAGSPQSCGAAPQLVGRRMSVPKYRARERRRADAHMYLGAPAALSIWTIRALVVPRTIESSTSTSRLPLTLARMGFSLMRTADTAAPGSFDESPADIVVLDQALPNGMPEAKLKPSAASLPESGTRSPSPRRRDAGWPAIVRRPDVPGNPVPGRCSCPAGQNRCTRICMGAGSVRNGCANCGFRTGRLQRSHRIQVAHECGVDRVQGTAFRGKDNRVADSPQAGGRIPSGFAHGQQLAAAHHSRL